MKRAQRKLMVARELVIRCLAEQLPREIITNPELVRTYLQAKFAPLEREVFACLYLDTRHRIIGDLEVLFWGTIDTATVHPRSSKPHFLKTLRRSSSRRIACAAVTY